MFFNVSSISEIERRADAVKAHNYVICEQKKSYIPIVGKCEAFGMLTMQDEICLVYRCFAEPG